MKRGILCKKGLRQHREWILQTHIHLNLIKNFMIEHYNRTFAYFLTSDYGNFITFFDGAAVRV